MHNKFSILNGTKYFYSAKLQIYLVFIPAKKCTKYLSDTTQIEFGKPNGMSEENIEDVTKSDSNFAQTFVDYYLLSDINFNGHCLINNISIPEKVINLYISYTLKPQFRNLSKDFT